ncbi:MAG: amidohydrolase [Lachnospiraceae bacterium]|jgi:predicted TIM-barrel fold metal-dependent hydrolase|nr:amidohydrolase [Lachnospiraceae bacterium]
MVIDVHAHPVLFGPICTDPERVKFRKQAFGLYKSSPISMEQVMAVMDHAGLDKAVLLAEDYSASMGQPIVSNEEIRLIMDTVPDRFIGFASADPRQEDAKEKLERAFTELKLAGLKLNLSHLQMGPSDERLKPLYACCVKYNKPVMFHSGFSWEPDSPSKYGRPILYEDVAVEYPTLRFCLSHLGWPWVDELMMLLLKYPNVYTDTATVFMDSPKNYYEQIFMKNMAPGWLQNNLMDKVMYGSNLPRFRQVRTKAGLESLSLRPDVLQKILGDNAKVYLGMEVRGYAY